MTPKKLPFVLQIFKMHTFTELNSFRDYITHSSVRIDKAQQDFEKEYKKFNKKHSKDEDDSGWIDYWSEEHIKFHEVFPTLFRQSTFISLYSFLETRLQSLCNNPQRTYSYKIKISDLSGENYIEKSKKYLKLVVGLNLDDLNTHWTNITNYQKIRNCFVHTNGNIMVDKTQPLNKQKFYEAVKKNTDLSINSSGEIKIENDTFLIKFIKVIEDYLTALLEKIKIGA
jgi:hypothetical protein